MPSCLDHPNVAASEWQNFRREYWPRLIEQVIDRYEARLPGWFMPLARGVAIPSGVFLRQAGYRDGKHRPRGWCEINKRNFLLSLNEGIHPLNSTKFLQVRWCADTDLWSIERTTGSSRYEVDEVLVHTFGYTPVFARSCSGAMHIAMHCHKNRPPAGFRWVKGMPDDPTAAVKVAQQRAADEARAATGMVQQAHLH